MHPHAGMLSAERERAIGQTGRPQRAGRHLSRAAPVLLKLRPRCSSRPQVLSDAPTGLYWDMDLDLVGDAPRADASTKPEYVNVIFALGASVGLAIGGCILFAVAYYHMPGFRRRRRARTTWSIPEQTDEGEDQSLHARVELLEQLTREWQAQLVESQDASGAELSERLSEICGVVQGELAKEAATR